MAAGVGARLSEISLGKPKCLIRAGSETLIQRIIRICNSAGIDDITIILGYEAQLIQEEMGNRVSYVFNPFYSVTNSISSLWLARHKLDGDVILMNADLFFEPRLFDLVLHQTKPALLISDSTRIETADYRFCFDGDRITHYGKHLSNARTDGEYVGIARINSSFIQKFKAQLEQKVAAGQINEWWEDALYSFIPQGVPIYHFDIAGTFWTEIDDLRDYNRLQNWLGRQSKPVAPSIFPILPDASQAVS